MNRLFLVLLLTKFVISKDFISEFEYGQMFYDNPRGVSCAKCHGKAGEGKFIGEFIDDKGNLHSFSGKDITKLDFKTFSKAISKGGIIMPRYYLTKKEIKAIYEYIKIVNLPPDKQQDAIDRQQSYKNSLVTDDYGLDSNKSIESEINDSDSVVDNSKNDIDNNISKPIEINSSLDEYSSDSDVNIQDSFNEDETIYSEEIENADDNNKDSIISTIFNSLEVEEQ